MDNPLFETTIELELLDPQFKEELYFAVVNRRRKNRGLSFFQDIDTFVSKNPLLGKLMEEREAGDRAFIAMFAEAEIHIENNVDPTGKYRDFVEPTSLLVEGSPTRAGFFLLKDEKEKIPNTSTPQPEPTENRPYTNREFIVARTYALLVHAVANNLEIINQKKHDSLFFLDPITISSKIGKPDLCNLTDYLHTHKKEFFNHPHGLFPLVKLCQKAISEYAKETKETGKTWNFEKLKDFIKNYALVRQKTGGGSSEKGLKITLPIEESYAHTPEALKGGLTP
ncbi:MAG: hypothetical protein V1746_00085 [bacterium]